MTLLHFVAQGGPVMYVLLLLSTLALGIVILKVFQFVKSGLRQLSFVDESLDALKAGKLSEALDVLKDSNNPIAQVMNTALGCCLRPGMNQDCIKAEIERVGTREIRELESWLRELSAIAHLSPLLGLLGTVLGMISSFMKLEGSLSQVNPALLAGGIWEALLTTAFGLAVAIPSMAAYYLLEGEVDRIKAAMKDASVRILVHFNIHGREENRSAVSDFEQSFSEARESYGV